MRPFLFFLLCTLGSLALSWPRPVMSQVAEIPAHQEEQYQLSIKLGDQFYYSREIPGNSKIALKYYHQALKLKANQEEVYWRLSRAMYGVSRAEPDPAIKSELMKKGIEYAEKAVDLDPQSIDAHLVLGMSYGHYILLVGLWRAWYYVFPVKEEMEIVLQLDPHNPYSHLILGTWYFKVPWWLGGDKLKGIEYFYLATQYQPDYTTHFLYLSRHLLELGRKQEASRVLQRMFAIETPYDPMIAIEDRLTATQLIEQHQLSVPRPATTLVPN